MRARTDSGRYAARMSRWEFVGRTDELNRLLAAVTGEAGRGLFFSGSAGIGKSRLLREGVGGAAAPTGTRSGPSRPAPPPPALPFGGLAQVLPAEQPPGLSPAGLLRWARRRAATAGRPAGRIVLAIDDAHLLDPPSAALVHLVARAENATVLGTLRDGEQVPLPIRALWTDDLVDHVELAPLPPAETTDLLAAILGGPVDAGSADRLGRLSGRQPAAAARAGAGRHRRRRADPHVRHLAVDRPAGAGAQPDRPDRHPDRPAHRRASAAVVELVAFGEPLGLHLLSAGRRRRPTWRPPRSAG